MASVIWIAFAGLFAWAAVTDARSYRIPNWIPIALAALFALAVFVSGKPVLEFWPHLAAGLGMMALGYLLYAVTGMGAGDAKLAAAAMLWAGWSGAYAWLFALTVAMAGLAAGLVLLRLAAATAGSAPKLRMLQRGAPVPLGIALAAATIFASWRFDLAFWAF